MLNKMSILIAGLAKLMKNALVNVLLNLICLSSNIVSVQEVSFIY